MKCPEKNDQLKKKSKVNKETEKRDIFFCIYLLVMPKYWGGNYFAHGRFPEVGQKQKTEKKREKERKTEQW